MGFAFFVSIFYRFPFVGFAGKFVAVVLAFRANRHLYLTFSWPADTNILYTYINYIILKCIPYSNCIGEMLQFSFYRCWITFHPLPREIIYWKTIIRKISRQSIGANESDGVYVCPFYKRITPLDVVLNAFQQHLVQLVT